MVDGTRARVVDGVGNKSEVVGFRGDVGCRDNRTY